MRVKQAEEQVVLPPSVPNFKHEVKKEEKKPRIKEEPKLFTLSPEGVLRRLGIIDQKPILIEHLEPEYVARTTSRVHFLSRRYGGSQQAPTPRPSQRFRNAHGMQQFCFLMSSWHPYAPKQPGEPGLAFLRVPECFQEPGGVTAIPTWVRRSSDRWQYIGHYRFVPSEPLTVEEWMDQDVSVRETRIAHIFTKDWQTRKDLPGGKMARYRCARHIAWRELQLAGESRYPTEEEIQREIDSARYREVTADLVREDFASGILKVNVCAMECYGYDEKFQRELVEGFSQPKRTWARVFNDVKDEESDSDIEVIERPGPQSRKRPRRDTQAVAKRPAQRRRMVKEEESDSDVEIIERPGPQSRKRPRRGTQAVVERPAQRRRMVLDYVEIVVPKWLVRMREREESPEL
ncbi:hypothetical protein CALVIDRAFT_533533 [Calocera viscosa TUFC12733]|uniref:DUF6697 domain-containing protein n=1 Tax=Calocera viscosa (strain TUFC12733) TaxID=1330018 RepID=A0A167R3Q7_CALVF|nr:hypothetical protein CALVIDRAFT_533533 [Calocera viscosa TUFC12733]